MGRFLVASLLLSMGCASSAPSRSDGVSPDGKDGSFDSGSDAVLDTGGSDTGGSDTGGSDTGGSDTGGEPGSDPFADAVVSFEPGPGAGFGADLFPDVVLGPPTGAGNAGSLDVLSLGNQGEIVLMFDDIGLVDGDGPDLLVFENPFTGWYETGVVAVSDDGETWHEWPCDAEDAANRYPGCAGVGLVWTHPDNDIDPTDPETAGGDAFDLAELGIERARYVRIRDSGFNTYDGTAGGFDLDAVAVVHGESL
jgi:hypothetical protein